MKWSNFIKYCNKINLYIRKHVKKNCDTTINSKVENYCCCSVLNVHSTVKNLNLCGTDLVLIYHINNLQFPGW